MNIYYLGYYADEQNIQNRLIRLSAVDKMNYIIDALVKTGNTVTVVSASQSLSDKCCKGENKSLKERVFYKSFFSFGSKTVLSKLADRVFVKLQLFFYLLKTVKKEDILVVYHSPYYFKLISFVKNCKNCKVISETEEIYYNVSGNMKKALKEKKVLSKADGYLFPTKLLDETVNIRNKPSAYVHGIYSVSENIGMPFNDGKTHCVYAGTFDATKGGAFAAIGASEYLDSNYHMHILGFGTDLETQTVIDTIDRVCKKTDCTVTFDGCLSGEDYIRFIQSCDIGLSCQNPSGIYNASSFPSKILSYMSNGLKVVSVRISAVETSEVGRYMFYYDEQSPKNIARAIKMASASNEFDSRQVLSLLDVEFKQRIKSLLGEI